MNFRVGSSNETISLNINENSTHDDIINSVNKMSGTLRQNKRRTMVVSAKDGTKQIVSPKQLSLMQNQNVVVEFWDEPIHVNVVYQQQQKNQLLLDAAVDLTQVKKKIVCLEVFSLFFVFISMYMVRIIQQVWFKLPI